ncbi:lytic transglycosylase domain-containing protein [Flavobacterium agrisoli]|uniref:LysM peptidoglycan-binding domain-containing protein n=1 Tax=Flavobacterium agrisoli TaxID=2793066 RepID=A0A934PMH5_9FLAO|nr:lytic transglycosylase domain-containing protein [Flavobacterium agrisoli]MBK0369668.1 LysM peptidoglycan-binding domain-containing protein [Flavobacterium agrisoli]
MLVKNTTLTVLFLFSAALFAQEKKPQTATELSYLDQVKQSFTRVEKAAQLDSLWVNELVDLDLYNNLNQEVAENTNTTDVDVELPTEVLKQRLQAMNQKSPFNIVYNEGLEKTIKSYLKYRRKSLGRLMALSDYYFPVFEEAFAKLNVPLEIKYLAIVESALNAKAVSRMGATGLWQFMYHTGKQYNLKIDSYIDERSDPLKSSEAAADYMSKMYTIFGDWDLVLASYNSGPGNVTKAIRRSGGKQNFWEIKKYLPRETQGYVPAFLATMYLYEYRNEHGIVPQKASIQHFETDTVAVKQEMSFKDIASLLEVPEKEVELLNPSYKLKVIPVYPNETHYLRLPLDKIALFTANEPKIYAYLTNKNNPEFLHPHTEAFAENNNKANGKVKYYEIQRGDNLSTIADKFDVSILELKSWNKLDSNAIIAGATLQVQKEEPVKAVAVKENAIQVSSKSNKKKTEDVVAETPNKTSKNSADPELYQIKSGDNLEAIAKANNTTVADLQEWNHLNSTKITVGKSLIVAPAEVVEVPVITKPKVVVEPASNAVAAFKRQTTQPVSSQGMNYQVQKGDSLFSIAKKYPGISVSDLKKWNDGIQAKDLKPGMKLKING